MIRPRVLAVVAVAVAASAGIVIASSISGDERIGVVPSAGWTLSSTETPTIGTADGLSINSLLASVM